MFTEAKIECPRDIDGDQWQRQVIANVISLQGRLEPWSEVQRVALRR